MTLLAVFLEHLVEKQIPWPSTIVEKLFTLACFGFRYNRHEKSWNEHPKRSCDQMERDEKSGQCCKFGVSKLGVLLCLVTTTFLLNLNETSKTTLCMLKKNNFWHAQETRKACLWKRVLNRFTVKEGIRIHRLTKKQSSDNDTALACLPRCFVQKRRKTDVAHWDKPPSMKWRFIKGSCPMFLTVKKDTVKQISCLWLE